MKDERYYFSRRKYGWRMVSFLVLFSLIVYASETHSEETADILFKNSHYAISVSKNGEIQIELEKRVSFQGKAVFENSTDGLNNFSWEKISENKTEAFILRYAYGKEGINFRSGNVTVKIFPSANSINFDVLYQAGPFFKKFPKTEGAEAIGSFPQHLFEKTDPPPAGLKFIIPKEGASERSFFIGKSGGVVVAKNLNNIVPDEEISELSEVKIIGFSEKIISWDLDRAPYSIFGAEYSGLSIRRWVLVVQNQLHSLEIPPGQNGEFSFTVRIYKGGQ